MHTKSISLAVRVDKIEERRAHSVHSFIHIANALMEIDVTKTRTTILSQCDVHVQS